MLPLDSPRWSELEHAYGSAADIPALLRQLATFPREERYDSEPWYSLWSSLCHQGDVYSASFAATPHIVSIAQAAPARVSFSFFSLPANIEICRKKKNLDMPPDLREPYFDSLHAIPRIVALASSRDWDATFACATLSAVAAAKGFHQMAEAIQEMTPEVASEFMEWFYER